jgi:hypothetical protein
MRWILLVAVAAGVWLQTSSAVLAGQYRLTNNDVIAGEPRSFNDEGVVFRLDVGGLSPRISWTRFSQEALRELAKIPAARRYAEPFIEIPPEVRAKEREKRKIEVREAPRVDRPEPGEAGAMAMFTTPAGLVIVGLFFLANLLAAYEVALYRNRPPALVCAVSAILPVAGPILFLSMADQEAVQGEELPEHAEAMHAAAPAAAAAGAGGGLSLAAGAEKPAGGAFVPVVYKRGDTTFNRRFFESKFPGFFRVVPAEAEKDLVLVIKTVRGEYVAKRISRIASNELHVQPQRGGEVMVQFAEMTEIQVRHKDAKA